MTTPLTRVHVAVLFPFITYKYFTIVSIGMLEPKSTQTKVEKITDKVHPMPYFQVTMKNCRDAPCLWQLFWPVSQISVQHIMLGILVEKLLCSNYVVNLDCMSGLFKHVSTYHCEATLMPFFFFTESSSSPSVTTRHFRRDQSDVSGQDKIVFGGGESCTRSNSLTQDQYNSIVKFQEQRGILLTWKKVLLKQRKQAVVTKRCLRQGTLSNDVQSDLDAESSTSSGFVPQKCNFADMIRLYYSQRANVQNTKVVVKRCLLKAKWRKQTQDCNDSCTSDIQCMSSLTSSGFNELERDLTDRKDEKKVVQKDSKMTVEEQVQMIQVGKMSLPPNFPGIHHSKSRTKKQHFSHTMLSPPPRAKMNSTYTPSNHLFHSLPQGTRDTTLTSTNTSPSNVPDSQSSHTYHIQGQVRRELSVSSPMDTSQSNIQRNTGCHIQSEEIQSLKSDICDRLSLTLPLFQPGRCKLASHQVQQMCQRVDYIIPVSYCSGFILWGGGGGGATTPLGT